MKGKSSIDIKSLSSAYIFALALVAALSTFSCILILNEIKASEGYSRIINISGRQRMLSQNITKNILLYHSSLPDSIKSKSREILSQNTQAFKTAHHALQFGNKDLGITSINLSPIIRQYFSEIAYHFNAIESISDSILQKENSAIFSQNTFSQLLWHESQFLSIMDKITFEFDAEAKSNVEQLRRLEIILLAITLITLLLEAFFIFKPIIRIADKRYQEKVEVSNQLRLALQQKIEQDKLLAEEQRNSVIKMIFAEEAERKRIANNLHESAGQNLFSLKMQLSIAAEKVKKQYLAEAQNLILQTQGTLEDVTAEIRNIANDLIPPSLHRFGLVSAIESELAAYKKSKNTILTFQNNLQERIDYRIEIVLFRAFQETVKQFIKVEGKQHIQIRLEENAMMIKLNLKTNHQHIFNEEQIIHFKPKILFLFGKLSFNSQANGTTISIEIPL